MKIDEVKDMLPQKPERLETVEEAKRQELVSACYDLCNGRDGLSDGRHVALRMPRNMRRKEGEKAAERGDKAQHSGEEPLLYGWTQD